MNGRLSNTQAYLPKLTEGNPSDDYICLWVSEEKGTITSQLEPAQHLFRPRASKETKGVTYAWPVRHEFEPSSAEDPLCTGNCRQLERPTIGVVVRRGGCQLECSPRHLTVVQNDELHHQKLLSS
ncbi:hypothetical protein TNCV_2131481 [Trichonephila clavipes]|nr:hypothetical protein TNCV_2131481 [Trichonephila clavipes]